MQLLPMASSPDGLISARDALITKTPDSYHTLLSVYFVSLCLSAEEACRGKTGSNSIIH